MNFVKEETFQAARTFAKRLARKRQVKQKKLEQVESNRTPAWAANQALVVARQVPRPIVVRGSKYATLAVAVAIPTWSLMMESDHNNALQSGVAGLCSGEVVHAQSNRAVPLKFHPSEAKKYRSSVFAKLATVAHKKYVTKKVRMLTRPHSVKIGDRKPLDAKWAKSLRDANPSVILSACGASAALATEICANNWALVQSVIRLQMLPWANSMNLKMVLLQSAWNTISANLSSKHQAMGTDNVIPIFALLLAKAGMAEIAPEIHFIERELEVLGEEELHLGERACLLSHLTAAFDILETVNISAVKIQRLARDFLCRKTNAVVGFD